jgi:hypothetical protein
VQQTGCTRFTWTNKGSGTCYLENGEVYEKDLVITVKVIGGKQKVCGYRY